MDLQIILILGAILAVFFVATYNKLARLRNLAQEAGKHFQDMKLLPGAQEEIQHARHYYNALARDFNAAVRSFPSSLVAGPFGFKDLPYLD
jgi:hypothetical protein